MLFIFLLISLGRISSNVLNGISESEHPCFVPDLREKLFSFLTCLFNLYAEYIMTNAGLVEAQAEMKIAGRNTNNLRYTDDTTVMGESEEELKSLLIEVKQESGKCWLKTQHSKN